MKTPDEIMQNVGIDVKQTKKEKPLLYDSIRKAMDDFADQYTEWKINKMTEVGIKQGQKNAVENLCLFSVRGSLRPVLLLASYCGDDNPNCTDTQPCDECLKMCNIAFIENKAIDINKVVCSFDFVEDCREHYIRLVKITDK